MVSTMYGVGAFRGSPQGFALYLEKLMQTGSVLKQVPRHEVNIEGAREPRSLEGFVRFRAKLGDERYFGNIEYISKK